MCITENQKSVLSSKKTAELLNLSNLKKQIPNEAFEKNLTKSIWYMLFDYIMWFGSLAAIYYLHTSGIYNTLPTWQQYLASFAYWNVSGFFMWAIFVVGHDCGHGTFSNSTMLNDIIGHITHGSILVPYYSWQLSHRRHHMYHNHIDKDYSHPWYTPDKLENPDEGLARMMESYPWMRFFFPFVGWPLYLYGMPDGSHWIPFSSQRMWKDTEVVEYKKCILSTLVVLASIAGIYYLNGQVDIINNNKYSQYIK
jgi:omega-3 fatty acid desaturase (delta-15 desaturase)